MPPKGQIWVNLGSLTQNHREAVGLPLSAGKTPQTASHGPQMNPGRSEDVTNAQLVGRAREQFMRELGKALGTSVRSEDDDIVLSGDQRERAKAWLESRGAARVVTGG